MQASTLFTYILKKGQFCHKKNRLYFDSMIAVILLLRKNGGDGKRGKKWTFPTYALFCSLVIIISSSQP